MSIARRARLFALPAVALMAVVGSAALSLAIVTPATAIQPEAAAMSDLVVLRTNLGDITVELNREKAPISTNNFLAYVEAGHYDGTIFHRVISNFMIQGGGFNPDMTEKPTGDPIKNEWQNGLKNAKYTLAMARTSQPDSATSQFFINVADNTFLDEPRDGAAYAVFGKVVSGVEVVDAIKAGRTATVVFNDVVVARPNGSGLQIARRPDAAPDAPPFMQDVPVADVVITKAQRLTAAEAAAVNRVN